MGKVLGFGAEECPELRSRREPSGQWVEKLLSREIGEQALVDSEKRAGCWAPGGSRG